MGSFLDEGARVERLESGLWCATKMGWRTGQSVVTKILFYLYFSRVSGTISRALNPLQKGLPRGYPNWERAWRKGKRPHGAGPSSSREETAPEGTCPTKLRPPVGLLIEVKNSSELLERSRELFGPSP